MTCGPPGDPANQPSEYRCEPPPRVDGKVRTRAFTITNAIRRNWGGKDASDQPMMCEIRVKLRNPPDNRGGIGFKLKTYEVFGGERYLVDRLEDNVLVPTLLCDTPCRDCGERDLLNLRVRDYCTSCWQESPLKYLMTKRVFDGMGGESLCLSGCETGWTTNGNTDHTC